jgi:glycosyltransferase involved in cell wall biosynthesis
VSESLVSVLINNFNYARFLPDAIESALAQSYRRVEVVVVDDGSSDGSREVMSSYGDRIVAVYKENGGQASAFNAGFAESRGDIITFLDSDDILEAGVVARVVDAFSRQPQTGMVQSRLELADAAGRPLGAFIPPAYVRLPTADLRSSPAGLNNVSWWAPTSGISVARTVLSKVLPLPEDLFRISADIGLIRACALCAPVVSLTEGGGYYRSHGGNYYNRGTFEIDKIRDDAKRFVEHQHYVRRFAEAAGVAGYPVDPSAMLDTVFSIQRMLLVRLDATDKRLFRDTRLGVAWRGVRATVSRPDVGPLVKALLVCWFALMATFPRRLVEPLANKTLFQQNRRRVSPRPTA